MQLRLRILGALALGAALAACDTGSGVAIGEDGTYTGTLTESSPRLDDDSAYAEHTIELEAGQQVDVSLESDDFDAFLHVRDPNDELIAVNDDSGSDMNSYVRMVVPTSGTYTILANSYGPEDYGEYTMHIRRETIGEVISVYRGELEINDPKTFSEFRQPTETLEASAGEVYEIVLMSSDFDTYLVIQDENGLAIAEDDDAAGSLNSRVTLPVAVDETYTIQVKSYDEHTGGAYTLMIMSSASSAAAGSLSVEQLTGSLSASSPVLGENGTPYEAHVMDMQAGDEIDVTMSAEDFDAYLQIWDADGNSIVQDDDSGGGLNARAIMTIPQDGTYQIIANSYSSDAAGDYSLTIRMRSVAADIEAGNVVIFNGTLSASSGTMADGSPYEEHTIEAEAGERLDITLTSSDFDAYLMVFDGDEKIAEDDDSGGGLDAQLFVTIPEDGTYRIIANSFGETAEGDYLIRVRR